VKARSVTHHSKFNQNCRLLNLRSLVEISLPFKILEKPII
jgi:hypothetical protein